MTCWAWVSKTCCSAQQSLSLCCSSFDPNPYSCVSLIWCFPFTWSCETSNCLERIKHWFLLYFFLLFLCLRDGTLWGDCLPHRGGDQEQMDRGMTPCTPPPHPGRPEQRRNCHSKSQRVDACECRFVCRRTTGGFVLALRVQWQKRGPHDTSDWHSDDICSMGNSVSNDLPDSVSVSSPHTQELDDLFILQ